MKFMKICVGCCLIIGITSCGQKKQQDSSASGSTDTTTTSISTLDTTSNKADSAAHANLNGATTDTNKN